MVLFGCSIYLRGGNAILGGEHRQFEGCLYLNDVSGCLNRERVDATFKHIFGTRHDFKWYI